jgi:hypothetical protein
LSSVGISFGSWRRLARLKQLAQPGGSLSSWYGNKGPRLPVGSVRLRCRMSKLPSRAESARSPALEIGYR